MSPGTYLRKRREAAGLSIEDVLARIGTEPPVPEHHRREWLVLIEADAMRPDAFAIYALRQCYRFDGEVLDRLIDLQYFGARLPGPRLCRECGCSQLDPCADATGQPCGWAERDLCTWCTNGAPCAAAMPVPPGDAIGRAA